MTHFVNVQSLDDLKAQFRILAMKHHPDVGGDTKTMQEINGEFDILFPVWKHRSNISNNETAESTRNEFYTAYGYKGENYKCGRSLKEIAQLVREYAKHHYNDYRFSITTSYASMCQELHIALTEGPRRAYKTISELTQEEKTKLVREYAEENEIYSYFPHEILEKIEGVFEEKYSNYFLTEEVKSATGAVEDYAKSFNYSDCDGQIDYFNVNFYFFGVKVGKWDKPYKIVPREKKQQPAVEYETVEVTKTRTKKVLEPREIAVPAEFAPGQRFILKSNFNYGCYRGAVYQIDSLTNYGYIRAYKMGKGYKNVCKGDVRGNKFSPTIEKLQQWVKEGAIAFIELIEVTKTEEYTSSVRRPKKSTAVSTDVRDGAAPEAEENTTDSEAENVGSIPVDYTITEDTDTRDGSTLWVVKFIERMSSEQYKETAAALKTIKGYYSRFKKGFIFRFDPTAALSALAGEQAEPHTGCEGSAGSGTSGENVEFQAEEQKAAQEAAQRAQAEADRIEDASTDIIIDLHLRPGEYEHSSKYRAKLAEWLDASGVELSEPVISRLAYKDLQNIIHSISEERHRPAAG